MCVFTLMFLFLGAHFNHLLIIFLLTSSFSMMNCKFFLTAAPKTSFSIFQKKYCVIFLPFRHLNPLFACYRFTLDYFPFQIFLRSFSLNSYENVNDFLHKSAMVWDVLYARARTCVNDGADNWSGVDIVNYNFKILFSTIFPI